MCVADPDWRVTGLCTTIASPVFGERRALAGLFGGRCLAIVGNIPGVCQMSVVLKKGVCIAFAVQELYERLLNASRLTGSRLAVVMQPGVFTRCEEAGSPSTGTEGEPASGVRGVHSQIWRRRLPADGVSLTNG